MKEYIKDAVIYQIHLRAFTKEGTIAAAEKYGLDAFIFDWYYYEEHYG